MLGFALLFAALAAIVSASGYIDGKEYVYRYRSIVHTGFPRIKHQYSGYTFSCNVVIQPHGDYGLIKVTDLKKATFNEEIEDFTKHAYNFIDFPGGGGALSQPFKVYRKNGMVTHFEVAKGESSFSVNIKKGMVSLFNLNFEEAEASISTEDNDIQKSDPDRHYYKVYEKGVLGNCETAYVIGHHPYYKTPQNNIVLNVTKVRNYHKCDHTPNHVYGTFHGHECGEAEHEKSHTLHGNAQYLYNIRGHRHHYVIEQIKTIGEIAYTPYPIEGQTVATETQRNLQLIDERPIATPIDFGADVDTYTSLEFDFEFQKNFKDPIDLKNPHYLYHIYGFKVPNDVIKGQMTELIKAYDDSSYQSNIKDLNFPAKFIELMRSLGTLGFNEIAALHKEVADIPKTGATAEQKAYRSLFLDGLVSLGTYPSFLFVKNFIESKKARPVEAAYYFNQLPIHIKEVSETFFDSFQELCFHDSVKKQLNVHSACLSAFSNIISDHCVKRVHPEIPQPTHKHFCQPEDAIKYFEYIATNFQQASDEKLKILYLKALGNIGLREIIPHIRTYIEGSGSTDKLLRRAGIWAIKNVGFRFPDRVKELLAPLLYNQTENYEYRLAAFIMLMMYKPQLYELEGVARALIHDPDDQMRSYIYSTFKSLANSTYPCNRQLSKDAHHALRILDDFKHKFEKYDYSYSKNHYVSGYDGDYDFGGSTQFSYFASDTGYVPRALYFGMEDFLGGKSMQSFGIGFTQNGAEQFLDKIFGPEGSFGKRSLFDIFKKRGKRDTGVEKELNEIKSKIHLPVIDYEPIHGEIFFKYMGNYLSGFHFDESTFDSFFKEGRFSIPNLPALYQRVPAFTYQKFLMPLDRFYVVPSEAGVPLLFDYKQAFYTYFKNKESSFKVEPGFFAEERGGKFPDHVKAETDGHFAIDKNLFAHIAAIMPFDRIQFGAGINRQATVSLPLKLKIDLDVKEKKLTSKWTPVAPHQIYHFKYLPYTFVDSYSNAVPMNVEENFKPVTKQSRKLMQQSYLHDALGVGFDIHAFYENEFNSKGAWLDFLSQKDYREKFYYLFANPHFEPYDVDVHFSQAATGATKEVEESFQYKYHDSEYTQAEFAAEGFTDYKISEGSDRAPFCSYELIYNLHGKGDKERKLHGSLSWTRDLKRSYHKYNLYYDRTPFTSDETEHKKACSSAYLKYPDYDFVKVAALDTIGMDHTVKSETKAGFGKDCKSDQKLHLERIAKTTEEQREYEAKREEPDTSEHYNPYAYHYQQCQKERVRGINYGEHCMEYIKLISTVHDYDFHANYENLSPRFLNFTYKLAGFYKHLFYNYGEYNYIGVENPPNELRIHSNVSLHLPIADIRVQKPTSNSHYTNVFIPTYHGFRSYPVFEDIHIKNSFSELHCKLEGDHVVTFDTYEYKLPPIDCYKVIAKDCSKNEYFTILGTKITHPKYHKAVKIFLGKHKIEALPVTDGSDIVVRVDGTAVTVTDSKPYLHYEGDRAHHGPDFYITHRTFYYALHSEKYGVIVEYDGHNIIIQVSPFYRGKLCGLCGNYNGLKYDGTETTDGCYYEDEAAYAYAYAIPSDTCQVPKFEPKCPNEGGFGCTKLRTHIINKGSDTCFSTEPIAECAAHCKARSTTTKTISYHCLPATDDSTKALVRQQAFGVIHKVRRKSKDHEAPVDVPDVCLKL